MLWEYSRKLLTLDANAHLNKIGFYSNLLPSLTYFKFVQFIAGYYDNVQYCARQVLMYGNCRESGSGSVGSLCIGPPGSFHHQAKIVRKTLIFFCFVTSLSFFTSVPDPHPDPYVFGHPGSAPGSVSQDSRIWIRIRIRTKM
jgi:hypothetical protein